MVEHVDFEADFFKVNPQFKLISPLNELPSKQMWVVFFFADVSDKNIFRNTPDDVKKQELEDNYIKDVIDWEALDPYIQRYKQLCMSPAERAFATWSKKLEERSNFIDSIEYDQDTWESLDSIMKNSKVIFDHYEKVAEKFGEQKAKSTLRGGKQESASEKGII